MDLERYRPQPYWVYIMKGVGMAFFALAIKLISSFACLAIYAQKGFVSDMPDYATDIVIFIASLFIYNSVFSLIMGFDRSAYEEYEAKVDTHEGNYVGLKRIFAYNAFIFEYIPVVIIMSVAAAIGANWELAGMFHFAEGNSPYASGIVPFLVNIVLISLFMIYERYEAIRYWKDLKKHANLEELQSKAKIIFRVFVIVIAYPIALPYIPAIFYLIMTTAGVLALLFTVPVLALTLAIIIASFILIRFALACKRRRAFFAETRNIVRQHGYEMSQITNPYASLFSRKDLCTFDIKTKQGSFNCLVIGNIKRSVPICFTSENEGYYRHRIGTPKHNITMQKHFEYSAPGDGRKIMIINPTPKFAYICDVESGKEKRVYNSELVWDFVAYEAEAFIASLDRGSLGKYTSTKDNDDVKIPRRFMPPVDV